MKPKHGRLVTCAEAVELCKQVGALIFWRPNGVINWLNAGNDRAEILRTGRQHCGKDSGEFQLNGFHKEDEGPEGSG